MRKWNSLGLIKKWHKLEFASSRVQYIYILFSRKLSFCLFAQQLGIGKSGACPGVLFDATRGGSNMFGAMGGHPPTPPPTPVDAQPAHGRASAWPIGAHMQYQKMTLGRNMSACENSILLPPPPPTLTPPYCPIPAMPPCVTATAATGHKILQKCWKPNQMSI